MGMQKLLNDVRGGEETEKTQKNEDLKDSKLDRS
jgi:hypothetical protein